MPTQSIPLGMAVTLLANVPYAVPGVKATLFTDAASPTITQSNTVTFTASSPVTFTGGAAQIVGAFVRAAADTLVILKRD